MILYKILLPALFILLALASEAQLRDTIPAFNLNSILHRERPGYSLKQAIWAAKKTSEQPKKELTIPASWSMQHWGWFCKAEWQIQQKIKLPLFVRLGNKDQVDWLEGKQQGTLAR